MQFSVNEWIKSGRIPCVPPGPITSYPNETRCTPPVLSAVPVIMPPRNTRLVPQSQPAGRRAALNQITGCRCLVVQTSYAAEKSRPGAPKATLQARFDRDLTFRSFNRRYLDADYFQPTGNRPNISCIRFCTIHERVLLKFFQPRYPLAIRRSAR